MSETGSTPMLCAKGCGFYGSPANRNLCSKCYIEVFKQESSVVSSLESLTLNQKSQRCTNSTDQDVNNNVDGVDSSDAVAKKKPNRCLSCKKKVGLLGFGCRCGGMFCSMHRYPEEHSCPFDYKTIGRDALARDNPLVVHDRLQNRII